MSRQTRFEEFMGRHKAITDESLLAIARQVFQEKGHSASTRDVAKAAGISQAALYKRFQSKEELFFTAILPPAPNIESILGSGKNIQNVEEYLYSVGLKLLKWITDTAPSLIQLASYPAKPNKTIRQAHNHFHADNVVAKLASQLSELQTKGLIRATNCTEAAELFLAMLHGLALLSIFSEPHGTKIKTDRVKSLVCVFCHGLIPAGNPQTK